MANVVDANDLAHNKHHQAVVAYAATEKAPVVAVSVEHGRRRQDGVFERPGLEELAPNCVIRAALRPLGLQTYFTAGVKGSAPDHYLLATPRAAGPRA